MIITFQGFSHGQNNLGYMVKVSMKEKEKQNLECSYLLIFKIIIKLQEK